MLRKTSPGILILFLILPCLLLYIGCSSEEGDKKKAEKFYQLGLKAAEDQKVEEAIIQFKNAIQKKPTSC